MLTNMKFRISNVDVRNTTESRSMDFTTHRYAVAML